MSTAGVVESTIYVRIWSNSKRFHCDWQANIASGLSLALGGYVVNKCTCFTVKRLCHLEAVVTSISGLAERMHDFWQRTVT